MKILLELIRKLICKHLSNFITWTHNIFPSSGSLSKNENKHSLSLIKDNRDSTCFKTNSDNTSTILRKPGTPDLNSL